MKTINSKVFRTFLLASLVLAMSTPVHAIIVSGDLTLNDAGDLITATNGNQYVGWAEVVNMNYAETLTATDSGGIYQAFHIASQTEAYEFFNLANTGTDVVDVAGVQYFTADTNNNNGERFGYGSDYWQYTWFLGDETTEVGFLESVDNSTEIYIHDSWAGIASADYYKGKIGWLLVNDSKTPVPEPTTMLLFGIGILGLVGYKRKRFDKKND